MTLDRLDKRIHITPSILGKIAKIDECKGAWKTSTKMSPQILKRLRSTVIITSTGASTRIEGAKMSDREIEKFLRGLKSQPPRNRDEQEVAGYADLLGRVFDHHTSLKLHENTILQFHDILLQFSVKDAAHRGKYKRGDNTVIMHNDYGEEVVLFNPTKPYLVKPEMDSAIDWANSHLDQKDLHPLLVTANFIFEFLAIHPFIDGNGRLSRALTNLLLLRVGYDYVPYVSLDEIVEANKEKYYLALRQTQKKHKTNKEDITPWLEFFLDTLLTQMEQAEELMKGEQPEKLLSKNQQKVLTLFESGEHFSVSEIFAILEEAIPIPTLKQVLGRLTDLKLIERVGQGRGTRYTKR